MPFKSKRQNIKGLPEKKKSKSRVESWSRKKPGGVGYTTAVRRK